MQPTRAAWFFVAGTAWLVLRGILVHALPSLHPDQIAQHGGPLLILPLLTVLATLTAPLFFSSFLFHHRFDDQRLLQGATILAAAVSLLSSVVVLAESVLLVRGAGTAGMPPPLSSPWLAQVTPFLVVGSLFVFLLVFSWQSGCGPGLRRSALVAAAGTLIPMGMMAIWVLHARTEGAFVWYPSFSHGLAAKIFSLAAAGALLWFLEAFAVGYNDGDHTRDCV